VLHEDLDDGIDDPLGHLRIPYARFLGGQHRGGIRVKGRCVCRNTDSA
jgi:hypothetical protein